MAVPYMKTKKKKANFFVQKKQLIEQNQMVRDL